MRCGFPGRRGGGFTLIELLVVMGIIALLVGILLPVLGHARKAAKSVLCLSNERQVATGIFLYSQDYDGGLPYSYGGTADLSLGEPEDDVYWYERVGAVKDAAGPVRRRGYLPLDLDADRGDVWHCPLLPDDFLNVAPPSFLIDGSPACQYSMNAFVYIDRQSDGLDSAGRAPTKIDLVDGALVLLTDVAKGRDPAGGGAYAIWFSGDSTYKRDEPLLGHDLAWPVEIGGLEITQHQQVVNLTSFDGHGESVGGKWDEVAMEGRFVPR